MTVSQDDQEAQVPVDLRETEVTQAFQAYLAQYHLNSYIKDKKEIPEFQVRQVC